MQSRAACLLKSSELVRSPCAFTKSSQTRDETLMSTRKVMIQAGQSSHAEGLPGNCIFQQVGLSVGSQVECRGTYLPVSSASPLPGAAWSVPHLENAAPHASHRPNQWP